MTFNLVQHMTYLISTTQEAAAHNVWFGLVSTQENETSQSE